CDDADAGAQVLLARGVGAVVVTLGARGCRLYLPGQAPLSQAGHAVQVIDTIGAGDTFTGALAAALARGQDWPGALAAANAAAALSTQGRGAIAAMPSLDQVRGWLGRSG
ncbi:MAG: carbohydrate kinase family protein, partial [Betaproteobacteria bacterium]